MNELSKSFYKLKEKGLIKSPLKYTWFFTKYFSSQTNFNNKSVLDIGGGIGLASYFSLISKAKNIVLLEPLDEGSGHIQKEKINQVFNEQTFNISNFKHISKRVQDYSTETKFDIIIMLASINHLDEEACIKILEDKDSYNKYIHILKKIYGLCNPNAKIFITDCSNRNFYNDIRIKNPFSPSIEWFKHQSPETWVKLLTEVGFKNPKIKWLSFKPLKAIGDFMLGNKIFAYFTTSNFLISMEK